MNNINKLKAKKTHRRMAHSLLPVGLVLSIVGLPAESAELQDIAESIERTEPGRMSGERKQQAAQSLPTIPLDLGEAGKLFVSGSGAAYTFEDNNTVFKLNAGINNAGRTLAVTGADAAFLAGDNAALGMNLMLSGDKSEVVLSGVSNLTALGLRVRAALSYMKGSQQFDFYRSSERANLSQLGYYGGVSWVNEGGSDLGVQSVGASLWGAQAKNHSSFSTQTYVEETPDYWLITRDQRLIAEGTLTGASIDLQFVPHVDVVLNGALGAEQLKFPFSDGSAESTSSVFVDAKISYRINDNNTLSAGYKYGVSEKGVRAEWKSSAYTLSAYKNAGQSGLAGGYGVNVGVDLVELLTKKHKPSGVTLAASMRPKMERNSKQLLQEVLSRPSQLPSNFLAKVDPTAVMHIKIDKDTLGDAEIDAQGNYLIQIGTGNGTLESAQRNGGDIMSSGFFAMQGNQLVIYLSKLPTPSAIDTYSLFIKDGNNDIFHVAFTVEKE